MGANLAMAASGPGVNPAGWSDNAGGRKQSSDEEVRQLVAALEQPFDPREIKWRVSNTSTDKRRGQMIAYADPRAYTDRLNALFTVGGWTRKYSVQVINNVERKVGNGTQIAGKVLVTCEVSIHGLGTHSGMGEEWADNENAGTAAEAQAFKRACACFGLGRYFYDLEGGWVDLDEHRRPKSTPKLPEWALPQRIRNTGTRPVAADAAAKGDPSKAQPANGAGGTFEVATLRNEVNRLANQVGYSLSRFVLRTTAKVETVDEILPPLLGVVAGKLEDTLRGVERLRKATAVVGQKRYSQACRDLTLAGDSLDDIPDRKALRELIAILEKEACAAATHENGSGAPPAGATPANGARPASAAGKELGEARKALIKEAQRVAKLREMKVADVVNRAAKEAFTFANLQRLTADSLPAILSATKRLRDVAA
jgi:hypothetical protein